MIYSGTSSLFLTRLSSPALVVIVQTATVTFGEVALCWSVQIKYLAATLDVKIVRLTLRYLLADFNNILNVMGSNRKEITALHLVQTYCLPSLTYSCETWSLRTYDVKRIDVAWNNAFRKIFNAYWYESVKPLQYQCSCLPVSIMLHMRKLLFWKKTLCSENVVLCLLAKSYKDSFIALADK